LSAAKLVRNKKSFFNLSVSKERPFMRVIGGELKGRRFKAGVDYSIRPTSDKVREAIFDILQGRIGGRNTLDLFAGTGALGIEALSRGASSSAFVDSSSAAIDIIRDNLKSLSLADRARVSKLELPRQLKRIVPPIAAGAPRPHENKGFDLVFADPPYGQGLLEGTLAEIERLDLAASGAIIVIEQASRENIAERFGSIELISRRVYSDTAVSFYERAL